jgi:hypothetical protein
MAIITRSSHPSDLWPGIKTHFGMTYNKVPPKWSQIFEKETSDKYQEKVVEATGFGMAPLKSEGAPIQYDSTGEGYASFFVHAVYGLGYIVTREELEDNLYTEVSTGRARGLAFSMNTTAEIVHANILNRGFDTNYAIGDGAALFSASHPTNSGSQSNLITAADLSETSLEDGLKMMYQVRNNRGLNIAVEARRLIVSTSEAFNAERILKTQLRVGTANNDVNAIRSMGAIPEVVVNPYLSDADAFFIQTNVPEGFKSYWRRAVELEKDNDFDTENAKAKATMRFVAGVADWRAGFGSAGV